MPIFEKDMPSVNAAASQSAGDLDKLRALILGHQQKMSEAQNQADVDVGKARNMIPVKADEAGAMLAPEAAKQRQTAGINAETVASMQKGQPRGTHVGVTENGMSVAPPDPLSGYLKGSAIQDREDNMLSRETGNLEQDFSKLTPYKPSDLAALNAMESMVKSNNSMSYGQLQNEFGKLAGTGVRVTEQDVARVLPNNLARDMKQKLRYLGVGNGVADDVLSPKEQAAALQLINEKRQAAQQGLDSAGAEVSKRGAVRAPTLAKRGKLDSTLATLGMSAKANIGPQAAKASGGLSPEEQQELAALKAKHGKR